MSTVRRAFFTINNPTFHDSETLYALGNSDACKYLVYGAEHTEEGQGTPHFQGFIIFNHPVKCNQVCGRLGGRAAVFFPKRTDPSLRMSRYCKKEGFFMEFGDMRESPQGDASIKPADMRAKAIEWFNHWEEGNCYVRAKDIPSDLAMTPGFLQAWKAKRSVLLGPDRPDMKTITIVGPTACGKSYAAHHLCPDHAKCFYGNSGCWFANGDAPTLLFEEFNGQIPLQKMLALLDHYPNQLEEKGSFCPAMYTTVIITSNISPDHWYGNLVMDAKKIAECNALGISPEEAQRRWNEAKAALYDRIGFRTNARGTGHYMEWHYMNPGDMLERMAIRQNIWNWVNDVLQPPMDEAPEFLPQEDTQPLSQSLSDPFLPRQDADDIDAWAAQWMGAP